MLLYIILIGVLAHAIYCQRSFYKEVVEYITLLKYRIECIEDNVKAMTCNSSFSEDAKEVFCD